MLQECKLSIIIPVYNAEKYIEEVIMDLIHQTLKEFEIIFVNDGSTDRSLQIIDKYKEQDGRIAVISQANKGAGSARNAGMAMARGEYLLFLDADDRFERNLFERAYGKAIETGADIVIYAGNAFDCETGKESPMPWLLQSDRFKDYLQKDNVKTEKKNGIVYQITNGTVWNKLFRTQFVRVNKLQFQEIYIVDSLAFVMLAMAYARKVAVLNETLVHYRKDNPAGQLKNHDKNPLGVYEALIEVKKHLIKRNIYKDIESEYINYAAESCVTRFRFFSSLSSEKKLYNTLHKEGLAKIGIEENLGLIHNVAIREKCRKMIQSDYEEFRSQKDERRQICGLSTLDMYAMPEFPIAYASKIIIYGAGSVGKSYFMQVMNHGKYKLVSWVDKQYKKCGYPVDPPIKIQSLDYDAVIVAVLMENTFWSIKDFLKEIGVEEKKIFWQKPEEV